MLPVNQWHELASVLAIVTWARLWGCMTGASFTFGPKEEVDDEAPSGTSPMVRCMKSIRESVTLKHSVAELYRARLC